MMLAWNRVVGAAEMERNGWIPSNLEVKIAGQPDGLDMKSEGEWGKEELKMTAGCFNWTKTKICKARVRSRFKGANQEVYFFFGNVRFEVFISCLGRDIE